MEQKLFVDLSIVIIVTFAVSGLLGLLKQPIIIGYLLTGALLSSVYINITGEHDSIATFAQIGVTLLLFMVGLHLNPRLIKDVGKVALITGLGQVIITFIFGFLLAVWFGFDYVTSVYIAIAMTFSSTIVIMKLLSDKGDIETLYGRISIGLLIVQDIIAIIVLMVISSMMNGFELHSVVFDTVVKGVLLTAAAVLVGFYLLPKLTKLVAASQELLLLFSIGWCLALASLFMVVGFSMEIGALLAGFTLSISPYRYEISSKMKVLRDFFIILFFVFLGSQMIFEDVGRFIMPIIVFSIFILIAKPLIMMILMGLLSYKKKNSFLSGLTIAQISEFSLIIIALGVSAGHVSKDILAFVTMIGLITIGGSSYFIMYGNKIYRRIGRYLGIFERKGKKVDEHRYEQHEDYDIVLCGYSKIGLNLLDSFGKMKKRFLVIDYNPEVITELAKEGIDCRYGDVSDSEILDDMNWHKVKMVISTIKDFDTNLLLLNKIRVVNKRAIVIVVTHQVEMAMRLYEKGASYVMMPNLLGGYHTSVLIEEYGFDLNKFLREKARHVRMLNNQRK